MQGVCRALHSESYSFITLLLSDSGKVQKSRAHEAVQYLHPTRFVHAATTHHTKKGMEVVRAPDRRPSTRSVRTTSITKLPPRPDSPRLGGTHGSLTALRSARLAQTKVWGTAAAVHRDETINASLADTTRRPVSVFGSMRSTNSTSTTRLSVISSRSEYRTAVFRRAASSHRYARISGNSSRGVSGSARVAPKIVLREQLAAIDEGLGAIAVVETPVLCTPHSHHAVHAHHSRTSNSSLHSLHDAPIEA